MEVHHKPKPWRGVSEFLKEYLIVVVGVLTALGAEAVVANLHERRLSTEAREAVRAEINLDLTNMKRRSEIQACFDKRLDEVAGLIAKAEAGQAIGPAVNVGFPVYPVAYMERWQAATAGGRASLLSSDEQRDFIRVYKQIELYEKNVAEEQTAWSELIGLEGAQHPSAELLAHSRAALGRAKVMNFNLQHNIAQAGQFAARIGVRGDDPQLFRERFPGSFCLPLSTPPTEVVRLTGQRPL